MPAQEPTLTMDLLPKPALEEVLPVRRRPPNLPKDVPNLIKLLSTADEEVARLAEGTLLGQPDLASPILCALYPESSVTFKETVIRILCAHPTPDALPTLEFARIDFPENATLRRAVKTLQTQAMG